MKNYSPENHLRMNVFVDFYGYNKAADKSKHRP
jgi:hypothetical protein